MPALPVILQPAKLAVPVLALSGFVVQARVPPGLVPMASVIELVAVVTVLPPASSTVTLGWVPQTAPLAPPPGWVVKTSWEAAPMVMGTLLLVMVVKPVAAAVSV